LSCILLLEIPNLLLTLHLVVPQCLIHSRLLCLVESTHEVVDVAARGIRHGYSERFLVHCRSRLCLVPQHLRQSLPIGGQRTDQLLLLSSVQFLCLLQFLLLAGEHLSAQQEELVLQQTTMQHVSLAHDLVLQLPLRSLLRPQQHVLLLEELPLQLRNFLLVLRAHPRDRRLPIHPQLYVEVLFLLQIYLLCHLLPLLERVFTLRPRKHFNL
ncbi:hypothetical protein PMAYCL1PPCAC_32885, partial [Pristionchus mayeri]